jgi:hypothetical protein
MSAHNIDEDFQHFLNYTNHSSQPEEIKAMLKVAYEHGSSRFEKDSQRLQWIEDKSKSSYTGITFDYVKHQEDKRGYRIMWFHKLNGKFPSLRSAIDSAMENE